MAEQTTTAGAAVRGRPAMLDDAIRTAAEVLLGARRPLVTGLVHATVEAQQRATELADRIGGAIDPASSATQGAALDAFQQIGRVTTTLGELRARADLIVFWGVDPDAVQPDFLERYVVSAPGAPKRLCIAVDLGDVRATEIAGQRLEIAADREIEALWTLRALVRGRRVEASDAATLGAPLPQLEALVAQLTGCRYGVVLYEADPPPERGDPLRAYALSALVTTATAKAPLRLVGIRAPGNAVGAENVLTWQTGYPLAVDFSRGYPRHGPDEFTFETLLARGDADAVLLVGAPTGRPLGEAAAEHLRRIPTIAVGSLLPDSAAESGIQIPTAPPEATPGSYYRMDGIGLRRRGTAPTDLPTDEQVLARLVARVRELQIPSAA